MILQDIIARYEDIYENKKKDSNSKDRKSRIHSLLYSDLGAPLPLHISLSRPVVLRTEQRVPFMEALQTDLQNAHVHP